MSTGCTGATKTTPGSLSVNELHTTANANANASATAASVIAGNFVASSTVQNTNHVPVTTQYHAAIPVSFSHPNGKKGNPEDLKK